ncbi:exocyst complex component 3-like protein 2 isoform X3 [Camelus ferus]|uniref:Exocyst complex component 3-like protein 2 isoform X3 n=1 Tax=Camelus ferus TaxID=419612 RepID=A0A8B8THM6_CAMFR|nr:exocyst complex component 3-like protein 2 isoform X3 [Camelus ferus]
MPILKSLGVADSKVSRAGTLPLRSSRNPFEEVSGLEEEAEELGTLPNGASCRRRATLEKLAGLAPFRLGRTPGRRAGSPGDEQPRSFLGRVLTPGIRRSSADFGLLARLQGIRAHGDEEAAGEAARRLAFLRLGRGPKPQRVSLAERVVPAGEAAPDPPPKVPEPPKVKEPLSVLEILSLIQQRELARADEHILELEAEELASSGGGAPGPPKAEGASGGRRARDVALLYEALQRELWALVRETLAGPGPGAGSGPGAVAQLGQVLVQEEAGRRAPRTRGGPQAARPLGRGWWRARQGSGWRRRRPGRPGAWRGSWRRCGGGCWRTWAWCGAAWRPPTPQAWAPSASTCAATTARWPSGSGPPPDGGYPWPTATRCCTGTTRCTPALVGETLRVRSSSLDLTPASPARTPSIRELTQRAGARGATIPETSFEG